MSKTGSSREHRGFFGHVCLIAISLLVDLANKSCIGSRAELTISCSIDEPIAAEMNCSKSYFVHLVYPETSSRKSFQKHFRQ